jgi:hypothetical protein
MWQGLKDWFKGPDGKADEMAALVILGVLTFLGLSIFDAVKNKRFDPQAFGIGFGATIGGAAVGMGLKARSERDKDAG